MADRYKAALDMVLSDDILDILDIDEWKELRSLDGIIPNASYMGTILPVRYHYDNMMAETRSAVRRAINETVSSGGGFHVPENYAAVPLPEDIWQGKFRAELMEMDAKRGYTVPKRELSNTQSFDKIWKYSLNQHQRALCPLFWHSFIGVTRPARECMMNMLSTHVATDFVLEFARMQDQGCLNLPTWLSHIDFTAGGLSAYFSGLFQHVEEALRTFAARLVSREANEFVYAVTPHLLLTLDDNEMDFLRLADDETRFQADVPEADMGPSGPGPAFHTGHSVASASSLDLDFENLVLAGDDDSDGAGTVVGSMVAQDGVSTVYNRHRVLAVGSPAASSASERFSDETDDIEYADAQYTVPAAHQSRGQALERVVEEGGSSDEDHLAFEFSDEEEEDSDEDDSEVVWVAESR